MSEKILRSFDNWVQQYMIKGCLCKSMQEITEIRSNGKNPQTKWKRVKEDIKENAIKIIEEERKKANKIIKGIKRDNETQKKRI